MADNTVYQLTIGLNVKDMASVKLEAFQSGMNKMLHSIEALEAAGVDVTFDAITKTLSDLDHSMTGMSSTVFSELATDADALAVSLGRASRANKQNRDEFGRFVDMSGAGAPDASPPTGAGGGAVGGPGPEETANTDDAAEALGGYTRRAQDAGKKTKILGGRLVQLGRHFENAKDWIENFDVSITGSDMSLRGFEAVTQKAAVNMGKGADAAKYMSSEILSGVASTQYSVAEISALNLGLSEAGVSMASFGRESQDTMIALMHTFDMSAVQIASTERLISVFGGSITELADDGANFTRAFGIPGVFKELAGITEFAMEAQLKFGKEVIGSGKDVVKSVMHMGGVFAKTFGTDLADGITKAKEHFDTLAGSTRHFKDVFLGLESGMDPLTKAFQKVGVGIFEVQSLFDRTKGDPIALAEEIKQLEDSIPSQFMKDRFRRELEKTLPKATFAMIANEKLLANAIKEKTDAALYDLTTMGKSDAAFKDLTKDALDTTNAMFEMWQNVKGLAVATLRQTGLTDMLKGAFRGARDTFVKFSKGVQEFVESEQFQVWAERIKPLMIGVGKAVLLLGTGFGGLATVFTGLMAKKAGIWAFGKTVGDLGNPITRLGKIVGRNGKLASGLSGIGNVASKVGKNIFTLGGLTTKLGFTMENLTKVGEKTSSGLTTMGRVIDGKVLQPMRGMAQWAGTAAKRLPGVGKAASGVSTAIGKLGGGVASTFAKMGAKGIPGVGAIIAGVSGIGTALMDMGDVLGDPNETGIAKFEALTRGSIKGVVGVFDSLLLGIPGMIINKFFPGLEDAFDNGFESIFGGIRDLDMGSAMGSMWDDAIGWIVSKFKNLDKFLEKSLPDFRESIASMGKTLGGAIGGMAKGLIDFIWWGIKEWSLPALIYKVIVGAFSSSDEAVAEGMEEAQPGIMSALGGIINSLGLMAGTMIKSIADGILGAFGTSFESIGINAKKSWNSIKSGAIDMLASVVGGIIRFGSLWESGMDAFEKSGKHGWAMFKILGLEALGGVMDTFLGEGGFVSSLLEGMGKVAYALGQNKLFDKITAARQSMEGFSSTLVKDAKLLRDAVADKANLTDVWAEAQLKANKAVEDGTKGILGYKDAIAESNEKLKGESVELAKKEERQGKAGKWARDQKREVRSGLGEQLKSAAGFKSLNSQAAAEATKNIKHFMDQTISGLSKQISSGTMSMQAAYAILQKDKTDAIRRSIQEAQKAQDKASGKGKSKAGDVADKAKRPSGMTAEQLSAFQKGLLRATGGGAGGKQRVQIWLRGATALDRSFARKSAVEHLNEGNG